MGGGRFHLPSAALGLFDRPASGISKSAWLLVVAGTLARVARLTLARAVPRVFLVDFSRRLSRWGVLHAARMTCEGPRAACFFVHEFAPDARVATSRGAGEWKPAPHLES